MNSSRLPSSLAALLLAALVCLLAVSGCAPKSQAKGPPRNIILLIGDGMGFNHVRALSLYEHDKAGALPWEAWPVALAMSNYPAGDHGYDPEAAWRDPAYVDSLYTDSAAAATALSTGVKTRNRALGVDEAGRPLVHLVDWLEDRGRATGLVSSVLLSHATPAGFCVHEESRQHYEAIARQMLLDSRVDVIMGCGHPWFDRSGQRREEAKSFAYVGGEPVWQALLDNATAVDTDGDGELDRSLADANGDGSPDPWQLVQTRAEFQALLGEAPPRRVLGVPEVAYTLQYDRAGDHGPEPFSDPFLPGVPSLEEMTQGALNILSQDPDGFFLMVEGGAIDWASHDHDSARMIEEMLSFHQTIAAVRQWVETESDWEETLVIVTSDHECGHLLGPGVSAENPWPAIESRGPGRVPAMEWTSGTHINSLVPIYARGRGAELLPPLAEEQDPRYGNYLDNAELVPAIKSLWDN